MLIEGFLALFDERIRSYMATTIWLEADHSIRWNKDGVFIFEPKTNYLDNFLNDKTKEEKEFTQKVKNISYEVIATNNTIFYITKIDKKYYITLIDNLKTNCSNALIQAF
jgi:hypothetical protein